MHSVERVKDSNRQFTRVDKLIHLHPVPEGSNREGDCCPADCWRRKRGIHREGRSSDAAAAVAHSGWFWETKYSSKIQGCWEFWKNRPVFIEY